ncbi:bifunctional methylenetetrahydrofolate dehydrogenase/methenyltetrahydrofolate cyclohydrolase FolD [Candidatus Woesearchaeota archaeon]|nr:bifunctional methylenetetrahydrofolate dehydrogenase/methenyltetrahydrofolate cyclohydrolase FolD [Candidatus Woesearchaeota archaeon]
MTATIIDGKKTAEKIRSEIKEYVSGLKKKPGLAVIQVGKNPASTSYVNLKEKDCKEVGIYSKIIRLVEEISEEELVEKIIELNKDNSIHGILVQLPLPKHVNEEVAIDMINPLKDVDGFHPVNAGNFFIGKAGFVPCTPKGVIRLLKEYDIPIEGKNAVVVGRSNIVGKPIAMLLMMNNATVTICHSKTKNLAEYTKNADILVVAVGKPGLIKAEMVKEDAAIIDVGITRTGNLLKGDVDFDSVSKKASYIAPVPGGVGPMTRAMLLENTIEAYNNIERG